MQQTLFDGIRILPPHILDLVARTGRFLRSGADERPWLKKAVLVVAVVAFAAGIFLSLRSYPNSLADLNWDAILIMALIATPATLALNALEFQFAARLIGQQISFGNALNVTIVGSAANLLPLPGAAMVRVAALKSGGATLRSGLFATAILAVMSLGLGFAYSGTWALSIGGSPYAIGLVVVGVAALLVAWLVARELYGASMVVVYLAAVRLGLIALDAYRTFLAFGAIGYAATFAQASVITISTVLAAIVAVVPSGLGLREGIAALAAPLVGLNSAAAFLAMSLSRIVSLSVVLLLTLLLIVRRKVPNAS